MLSTSQTIMDEKNCFFPSFILPFLSSLSLFFPVIPFTTYLSILFSHTNHLPVPTTFFRTHFLFLSSPTLMFTFIYPPSLFFDFINQHFIYLPSNLLNSTILKYFFSLLSPLRYFLFSFISLPSDTSPHPLSLFCHTYILGSPTFFLVPFFYYPLSHQFLIDLFTNLLSSPDS